MSVQALNIAPKHQQYSPLFKGAAVQPKPVDDADITAGISFLKPLNMDVFEKNTSIDTSSLPTQSLYTTGDMESGETFKNLLANLNFLDKKVAAHYFLKKASPIQFKQPLLDDFRLEGQVKSELVDIANKLELLSNTEKVEFMKDVTGASSNFSRYAEKVLIQDANPGIKETLKLFKPQVKDQSVQGYRDAFSAMGVGLMMMPLLLGGKMLFNPALLGRFVAGLGIALV